MKNTIGATLYKMGAIAIIALSILLAFGFFAFKAYQQFSKALEDLSQPSEVQNLTEKIIVDVNALESQSRLYYLSLEKKDLEVYVEKTRDLQSEIAVLRERSEGRTYHLEVDTLYSLFLAKAEGFQDLIKIKSLSNNKAFNMEALEMLSESQKKVYADSLLIPIEKIVVQKETEVEEEKAQKNWFEKLFSKKKKGVIEPIAAAPTLVNTLDTTYVEKVDTLLSHINNMSNALLLAEKERRAEEAQIERYQLDLLKKDKSIVDKLQSILYQINTLEKQEAEQYKQKALAVAQASFRSTLLWVLLGGLVSLLLVFWVVRDVFKQEQTRKLLALEKEKAAALASAKASFLANMSHEIRTPLHAVLGFAEQLALKNLSNSQETSLRKIEQSGNYLLSLVNDILDYSKIESGKLQLEEIGFCISDVVKESLETVAHLAEEKQLILKDEIDPSIKKILAKGDPIRLKQVLINILGNGLKFTEKGYVSIKVFLEHEDEASCVLTFVIKDTGKGIEKSMQQSIFNNFNQEDSSVNRKYGGTGLGLAISKQLVAMHGGQIKVESKVGEGAEFSFSMCYKKATKNEYKQYVDIDIPTEQWQGKKLLMVDDDAMNHELIRPFLKQYHFKFEATYRGEEALEKCDKEAYDFILVDLQMPGMSGWEIIKHIKKHPKQKQAKLVLCTANAMVKNKEDIRLKNVDALLLKPFKIRDLKKVLWDLNTNKIDEEIDVSKMYTLTNFKAFAHGDETLLINFLKSFLESNKQHLIELEEHFTARDFTDVAELAHKMKNTYGQLEAEAIVEHLQVLEKCQDHENAEGLINHIQAVLKDSALLFEAIEKDIEVLEHTL